MIKKLQNLLGYVRVSKPKRLKQIRLPYTKKMLSDSYLISQTRPGYFPKPRQSTLNF